MPASTAPILLVHGAANSAGVWTYWQEALAERGWTASALDLRGHGANQRIDLSRTTMADYADDVRAAAGALGARPAIMGWSMGGLVALMAAASGDAAACVALAPSATARELDPSEPLREGEFGPDHYGITSGDPADQPTMPDLDATERAVAVASLGRESHLAQDERRRGIVIESLPCPLLLVTGTEDHRWPVTKYEGLQLPHDHLEAEGASHWGLVLNRRTLPALADGVVRWLDRQRL